MSTTYFYRLLTIAGIVILSIKSYGQDKNLPKEFYIASTIPDSLKGEANSVVRYSSDEVTVKAAGKMTLKHHAIITVLNEKGDAAAQLGLGYDKKFSSVDNVQMLVYNADGTMIKKYHKSDFYDYAATDGISIVTDDRMLAMKHPISAYPTTIEVIFEEDMNSYLDLGEWEIQRPERAVQNAEYTVLVNPSVGFRYMNKNTTIKPEKTPAGEFEKYTWHVKNLKAIKPEDDAESWQVMPRIMFAANSFQFGGIPGDISTWQNFGKWLQTLNADVCSLSPERIAEVKKMTADFKTDKEKARFLYQYMQQNMRYVSIQLGIGGLKPFPATFVDQKKYGDCKALSNYMYALLKAADIPSYYAIINAGSNEEPADPAFPSDPFNHIILCVPFKGDTTWLECTNMQKPFGKLGPFTENRYALLVTEDGGKLVKTPRSTDIDNQFNSEAHVVLDADGGAKATLKILSTGEYRDDYLGIAALKTDEQKQVLIKMLNMKQPSLFEFKPSTDKDGIKELDIELEYDKFCDVSAGNKQFYKPRVFDLWKTTVPILEKRKSDFFFEIPMLKTCVTTIDLPAGFEIDALPADQSLKFTYGTYDVRYVYDATKNQVVSTTKFNLKNHVIPAAKYTELQVYLDAIAKAQNKKLVIRRKA
ncbi:MULTISPECIES: DUF3857 domain-containing transglutaminase family protein [Mucilaginibacter]|uniref:DUF3857 domain-containing transglutaminase family protein n=1 Tax=Mucilaginibacter TaxID=423349 RepID=UPI00087147DA|nr:MULTISPECIES: DUF3857 domain-containing transglutaminase family protein [Mucilaginibacter]GGB20885.1 hypothetical protein GCM10011500_41220 [Mucilaginibacter rubeus]SCW86692.1 Transglutaminase-like superfamily protein [Mucilaginibacter sp. NFR10]